MKKLLLLSPLVLGLAASCTQNQEDGIADNPPTSPGADPYGVPQDPVATAKPRAQVYNGGRSNTYSTPNIPHEPLPDTNTAYSPPSYSGQRYGSPSTYSPPTYNSGSYTQNSDRLPSYGGTTSNTNIYSPPASTPTAPPVSVSTIPHTVQSGDTLWGLSKKYGTTVADIQAANGMGDTKIMKGTTIQIPASR